MSFGWSVKVTLFKNKPCTFSEDAPEDEKCIVTNNNDKDTFFDVQRGQRRQTGESFRSSAPPDCRVSACEDPSTAAATQVPTQAPIQAPTQAPTQAPIQLAEDDDYIYDEI